MTTWGVSPEQGRVSGRRFCFNAGEMLIKTTKDDFCNGSSTSRYKHKETVNKRYTRVEVCCWFISLVALETSLHWAACESLKRRLHSHVSGAELLCTYRRRTFQHREEDTLLSDFQVTMWALRFNSMRKRSLGSINRWHLRREWSSSVI